MSRIASATAQLLDNGQTRKKTLIDTKRKINTLTRFHAWQSALLFSTLFFIHLLFSWSRFLSWVIFLCDLGLIAYLTMRAYLDGMFIPFFVILVWV